MYWLSYWVSYFYFSFREDDILKFKVSIYKLYSVLLLNMFLSYWIHPCHIIIYLPNNNLSYLLRWVLAAIISDIWIYTTHRLLHTPLLYEYHKMHHLYQEPHASAGLYAHPVEFIFNNYLGMIIPLSIISHQELMLFETAFVAYDIVRSHIDKNNYHGLHHLHNNCNYGFLFLSDYIFDTLRL
jgi:sterol desaturase/sphingolipid hydroxylase (fatty acid hydroxylase superfamily)